MRGGKMTLRGFYQEYKSEFAFGFILLVAVIASFYLSQFIPEDIFELFINPAQNICLIVVCLYGAWLMSRHLEGNRLRKSWMVVLLIEAALFIALLIMRYGYGMKAVGGTTDYPHYNMSLIAGNFLAWMLLIYPSQVLRPEWFTWKTGLALLSPILVLGIIDYYLPVNLIYLIMLYPAIVFLLICRHIRKYRQWCEDHYSTLDNIDTQWVVRYLLILFLLGVSFYFIGFWYIPNRIFTQQWLLLLLLAYATEQILYRKDPWEDVQEYSLVKDAPSLADAEADAVSKAEANTEADTNTATYARMLEQWMLTEKPYLNPNFQLMDLREVLPMNRTYLSRFIHEAFNCSFYQYVTNYRIEEAKRLMREHPELKVQEVAAQSGFSSPTVFGRTFARETGLTPSEWIALFNNS